MIKAPVGETVEPVGDEDQDDEQTSAVATLIAAPDVTTDDASTEAPRAEVAEAQESATTEIDSAKAGAHDAAAEIATDESDLTAEDFKDLPIEELSIIEANDEIEQVIALVPEVVELADTEVLTWVPADVAEPGRSKRSDQKAESKKPAAETAEPKKPAAKKAAPKKAESKKPAAKKSEPKKSEPKKSEPEAAPATGLFAALRKQADPEIEPGTATDEAAEKAAANASAKVAKQAAAQAKADQQAAADAEREAEAAAAQQAADEHAASLEAATDMARQRDAVVAELSTDIEKRLKRALADEQNDVLAGIRSAGRNPVELISLVGETDDHVLRYVVAINEVAAMAYAAGAALVDGEAAPGEMPAGAVEELLGSAVVLPMRLRLLELDSMETESAAAHLDAIRAFYRQRKTDHLGEAANNLAGLLVTAGACDVLPTDQPIPWLAASI